MKDRIAQVIPVVKDLASKHMSTNSPAVCPVLAPQPVMTKSLGIKIIDLKTTMMDVCRLVFGKFGNKEALGIQRLSVFYYRWIRR